MKKKLAILFTTVLCLVAILLSAACSGGMSSDDSGSAASVDYSDNSLIAYHESMGNDISSFTEVSVDNCSECHGDRSTIQASTKDLLEAGGTTANPHVNHRTKEIECYDCHSLTEVSTLYCNESCHTWNMTRDNGTWDTD
jgi:hypothetical protein